MNAVTPYLKTIVAVLGAVLTAVMTQFPDSEQVQQWGPIVSALLTALAVYVVPNLDPKGTHQDESTQPPTDPQPILGKAFTSTFHRDVDPRDDSGESSVLYALLVVVVVVVILALVGVI